MNRWLDLAKKLAFTSEHPKQRLAALVVKGGKLLSFAVNLPREGRHAEMRALRPHQDLEGCTLYVYRIGGRISKPCAKCWMAARKAGIRTIVYVDDSQEIVQERP